MNDCPLPAGSKVIGYLRVSGVAQKEKGTIAGQMAELDRYVSQHHLELVHPAFVDEAKPGSSTVARDGFQDMIAFTRQDPRPCDAIVFWSWDRFARDENDAHFFKADLRRRGYVLVSLSDGIPQNTDFDYVMESLIHWKDAQFLSQLSRNVKRGCYLLAREGYAPGGYPPKGYRAEYTEVEVSGKKRRVRRWIPDPEWAPVIRRAFEMRAAGAGHIQILNATGICDTAQGLIKVFQRKTYLGYRLYGDIEVPNAHDPLVTQDLWDRVQATLSTSNRPIRHSSPHLLSGLLTCAYCDAGMLGKTQRNRGDYRYYLCSKKSSRGYASCENKAITGKRLDSAVLDVVMTRLLNRDFVARLLAEVNIQLVESDMDTQIAHLQNRLRSVDRAIGNLLDLAEKAGGTKDILSRLSQRQDERHRLQEQIESFRSTEPAQITESLLLELLAELRAPLSNGTLEAQRRVLRSVVDEIRVEREQARLFYRLPNALSLLSPLAC